MDHQQNYEFNDPNSFAFISSFTGSENFILAQPQQGPQQLNGKDHSLASSLPAIATNFDQDTTATSQFITQSSHIMYDLPETTSTTQPSIVDYPSTINYLNMTSVQPDMLVNSQKDSLFNLESPSAVVPANIIQQKEPETVMPSICDVTQPALEPTKSLITTDEPALEITEPLISIDDPSSKGVESEIKSKQPIPSEDLPEVKPAEKSSSSIVISEENNIMKALGVAKKEAFIGVGGSRKRRRRILLLNEEDSDDDNELKKEMQISPEKEKETAQNDTEDSSPDSDSDDPSIDPSALKARSLLKSAVIIQGPESKKKKRRIFESDDEEEITSVDDIGLMESNEHENDDELLNNDIIISEPAFECLNEDDKLESSETVIVTEDGFVVPATPAPLKDESVAAYVEQKPPEGEIDEVNPAIVKNEHEEKELVKEEGAKSIIKTEDGEMDPSMSVEEVLEKIKPMADDDEFFKVGEKSDDSDCQFVSNEDYFGTPDVTKSQSSSNRRRRRQSGTRRKRNPDSGRQKRSNKYEKDFVEGSSESEDTSFSEPTSPSSDSSTEEVRPRGRPIVKKSPIIVQTKSFSVTRVPIKNKIAKKDRFYDRSRDIPNDVYFGDVKVPLHVLHTRWNSDVESSDSSEAERVSHSKFSNNRFVRHPSTSRTSFSSKTKPSYAYIDQTDDPKLSTLKELARISGIKINYARLFDGVRSTDDKCMLIRRILAQKGLQGEPTIAKCKQLRLDLQAKRESAELDKSLIIRAEGRTRRATRNVSTSKSPFLTQPSTSSMIVQPETLQTLSKIRRVVDSDSE